MVAHLPPIKLEIPTELSGVIVVPSLEDYRVYIGLQMLVAVNVLLVMRNVEPIAAQHSRLGANRRELLEVLLTQVFVIDCLLVLAILCNHD